MVFLDCTFAVNLAKIRNRYAGIFLYQSPGDEIRSLEDMGESMNMRVPASLKLPANITISNRITACAFIVEPGKPWITNVYYPIDQDPRDLYGNALGVGRTNVSMTRYGMREWVAMRNIALNFLDLLNTPDVYIVQMRRRSKNAERRKRQGKPALPPSDIVYLRPSIRRYVDDLKASGQWDVSHRFWVRGHFRHYRSERYARLLENDAQWAALPGNESKVGKCPTCHGVEFIKPFIKGHGLLVKKRYMICSMCGNPSSDVRPLKDRNPDLYQQVPPRHQQAWASEPVCGSCYGWMQAFCGFLVEMGRPATEDEIMAYISARIDLKMDIRRVKVKP
jgi:hypothetical protein